MMVILPMVVETVEIIDVIRQIAESDPRSLPSALELLKPVLRGRDVAQLTRWYAHAAKSPSNSKRV